MKRSFATLLVLLALLFGYWAWPFFELRRLAAALEAGDVTAINKEVDYPPIAGPDMLHLRTPVELRGEQMTTVSDFAVSAGRGYHSSSPIPHLTYRFPSRRMQKKRCNRLRLSGSRGRY